jgi:UDP-N-acetylmuramoyl-L-alanyl-D-glutamate--2,6-diaminopimelate ligase
MKQMTMRLSNLIAPTDGAKIHGEDRVINGITADSRQVRPGYVFVAVPGHKLNGEEFISQAVGAGASVVVVEEGKPASSALPDNVSTVSVNNVRHALSLMASRFYPRQPQIIAAVTGTSGKTSTVQFVRELWTHTNHKAASLGTLGIVSPQTTQYGSLTTPDPTTLHRLIDKVCSEGVTHLAMEASSHGIQMHRLDGVKINIAAFTNLSRDHLDYHETMEGYFSAKLRLFSTLLRHGGTAVLNADIPEFEDIKGVCEARNLRVISFGREGRDITLLQHAPDLKGQRVRFEMFGKPYEVLLPVLGEFQIWNSLCALSISVASGENPEKMAAALEKLSCVPGRLDFVGKSASGGLVFIDYAHKPGALENVLRTMRPHVSSHEGAQLHVLFGCGGNRDKGKRPLMGDIAQKLADQIIITDDNPRDEQAETIRKEILSGCASTNNVTEIADRSSAIKHSIEKLQDGDVLIIAGKGHEEGQIIKDKILPFNDKLEAQKALGIA